jgi:hypothetical protein
MCAVFLYNVRSVSDVCSDSCVSDVRSVFVSDVQFLLYLMCAVFLLFNVLLRFLCIGLRSVSFVSDV